MNAAEAWTSHLPRTALARLARHRWRADDELAVAVADRFAADLAGLLNQLHRSELDQLAERLEVDGSGRIGQLRARLWLAGAELEADGRALLGTAAQPVPVVLGDRLVFQAPVRGAMPPAPGWPRPIPPAAPLPSPAGEPESVTELLGAADALVGARLGARSADKGEYGTRVARLLGVIESNRSEPDWRGLVEIKTVPVVVDPSGLWRVKEDPAISMEHASPLAKMIRVLWIARVEAHASPVLSWYYQELDETVAALARRDLHTRPKGPAGTTNRGWYLRKRFFLSSGFLASLNG